MNVPGLNYVAGYVSGSDEAALFVTQWTKPWLDNLRRRVQHHGYRYDYKARKVDLSIATLGRFRRELDN